MARDIQRFGLPSTPHRVRGPAAKVVGFLVLIAFPVIAIVERGHLMMLLPAFCLPLIAWGAYLVFGEVRYLEVTPRRLRIGYRLRSRNIRLEDITGIERVAKPSAAALYGHGFSLHSLQRHMSKQYGPLEVIATTVSDFILIRRGGRKPLLVGPADADAFERALRVELDALGREGASQRTTSA